jgi:ESS family glutamate:Na+ symporter
MDVPLNDALTLAAAIATIAFGMLLNRAVPVLERVHIPPAVTGGLVVAVLLTVAGSLFGLQVKFATDLRALLLLVFFASLGLSARFGLLRTGGPAVLWICVLIVLVIVAQNLIGIAVAKSYGLDPSLGLFMGSIPYLGGHGTTAAWAQAAEAKALPEAFEIGIASATLGLIAGGLVGGPAASVLARRAAKRGAVPAARGVASNVPETPETLDAEPAIQQTRIEAPEASDRWVLSLLVLAVCLVGGHFLGQLATAVGFPLPGFLTALLAAVVLTNVADAVGRPVDFPRADLVGTLALRIFLAMSMLSLDLSTIARYAAPLATALVAQVAATALIAIVLVNAALRGGHEGAVGSGGFIGFGLGAMPVGLATMKRIVQKVGPAPRAFIVVTLAAALFQDTANAILVRAFFWWLGH